MRLASAAEGVGVNNLNNHQREADAIEGLVMIAAAIVVGVGGFGLVVLIKWAVWG